MMSGTENFDLFLQQKRRALASEDLSRKGCVDAPIVDLVDFINSSDRFFTTSSCSGRTIVFEEQHHDARKKGCKWLYTTHDSTDLCQLTEALHETTADAYLKFEPFILHVQCRCLEDARLLHEVAAASGFRNSGITIGKKGKIMTAVRSTHSLEVPLSHKGRLLVDSKYISHLANLADDKMKENIERTNRFFENLKTSLTSRATDEKKRSKRVKRHSNMKDAERPSGTKAVLEEDESEPDCCVLDECTMDPETGIFSLMYSEDG